MRVERGLTSPTYKPFATGAITRNRGARPIKNTVIVSELADKKRREIYARCDFKDYEPRKVFKCKEYF